VELDDVEQPGRDNLQVGRWTTILYTPNNESCIQARVSLLCIRYAKQHKTEIEVMHLWIEYEKHWILH
jgi:hypothetical protein